MVDVDLDGPGGPEGSARDGDPARPAGGSGAGRPRVAARGLVVALLVAVLLAVTWRTVADNRDARMLAAYAGVPGISASLRQPLTETYRAAARAVLVVAGDTVLVRGGDGLTAVDARSGVVRWTRGVEGPGTTGLERCAVAADGANVACAVLSPTAHVLHVDLADGSVTATTPLPVGVVDWALLEDDVLLARRDGGRLVVARVAPGTTTTDAGRPGVVWRASAPLGDRPEARPLLLGSRDGLVTVTGAVAVVVRADDGRLLGAWTPARGHNRVDVATTPDGFGVWPSPARGRWFDRTGTARGEVPGSPVTERVTDGSAPEVVLTLSPLLTAVDVRTGEVLWARGDGGSLQPSALPLRLDGLVVLPEGDRLLGMDVRTGRPRWSAPAPRTTQTLFSRPLTDGRRLVLTDLDDAGALVLRALDLASGKDVWRVPAPASSLWVYGIGGRGVMQGGGDVVVLG